MFMCQAKATPSEVRTEWKDEFHKFTSGAFLDHTHLVVLIILTLTRPNKEVSPGRCLLLYRSYMTCTWASWSL